MVDAMIIVGIAIAALVFLVLGTWIARAADQAGNGGGESVPPDTQSGTHDPPPGPFATGECSDSKQSAFAEAIAFAEGYYSGDTRPFRNNNPGDFLGSGDSGSDGAYAVYSSPEKGWARLCYQVNLIFTNRSQHYSTGMTIDQVAHVWTATQQEAWAKNVSTKLGVSTDTTLDEFIAA